MPVRSCRKKVEQLFSFVHFEFLKGGSSVSIGKITEFCHLYDLPEAQVSQELQRFRRMATDFEDQIGVLKFLYEFSDLFPHLYVACKTCLTLGVSIAGCERSFSKLKLIKTYLRNRMEQDNFNSLIAILSIEADWARKIDLDTVVKEFF